MQQLGIRIAATALSLGCLGAQSHSLSPSGALATLKAGNERFAAGSSVTKPIGEGVRRSLARGQSPLAIVVTCSDSRVTPEHVFNAGLGEIFVIRTTGGACDPETLASIEYAAVHLQTPLCVVMGHSNCTAVRAAADDRRHSVAMTKLIERIRPALAAAKSEGLSGLRMLQRAERENAYLTIDEAFRRSQALTRLAAGRKFRMVAAHYDVASGKVEWLPHRQAQRTAARSGTTPGSMAARGVPPHTALTMLHAGHQRYLSQNRATGNISAERRHELVKTNRPIAVVVTCADSRVPPEHIFDTGLGELFVIRVAGNVANDEVIASVEHAVETTGASLCIVLGHQSCGAVGAAIQHGHGEKLSPSMQSLLRRIQPAVTRARRLVGNGEQLLHTAVQENTKSFLTNVRNGSRALRLREQAGTFALVPAMYMLDTGDIHWLKDSTRAASAPPAAPLGDAHRPAHPAKGHEAHHGDRDTQREPDTRHGGHDAHGKPKAHHGGPETHGKPETHHGGHDAHGKPEAHHGGHDTHAPPASPGWESAQGGHADHDAASHAPSHGHETGHSHTHEKPHGDSSESLLMTVMAAAMVTIAGLMGLLYWQRRS